MEQLMKKLSQYHGHALFGTLIFLLIVMILWLGVARQVATCIRIEKNFQSQHSYYNSCIRALSWGLALLETGIPPSDPYSCKMQVGEDNSQIFVVTFTKIADLNFTVTARPAELADELLPSAPETFTPP